MTVSTVYGPAEVIAPSSMRDGSPAYCVLVHPTPGYEWPFHGTYAFTIVPVTEKKVSEKDEHV